MSSARDLDVTYYDDLAILGKFSCTRMDARTAAISRDRQIIIVFTL